MGGPLVLDCLREPKSSRSVCQAEILSMDEGCKSLLMVRNVLDDLQQVESKSPIPLFNDNRGAVDWSTGCSISKKLRHFNIRDVAVRNDLASGNISISHLPGKCNIADIFTKEIWNDTLFQSLAFQLISPRDQGGCQIDDLVSSTTTYGQTPHQPFNSRRTSPAAPALNANKSVCD